MFNYPRNLLSDGGGICFVFSNNADYHWILFSWLELFAIFQKHGLDLKRLAKKSKYLSVVKLPKYDH